MNTVIMMEVVPYTSHPSFDLYATCQVSPWLYLAPNKKATYVNVARISMQNHVMEISMPVRRSTNNMTIFPSILGFLSVGGFGSFL